MVSHCIAWKLFSWTFYSFIGQLLADAVGFLAQEQALKALFVTCKCDAWNQCFPIFQTKWVDIWIQVCLNLYILQNNYLDYIHFQICTCILHDTPLEAIMQQIQLCKFLKSLSYFSLFPFESLLSFLNRRMLSFLDASDIKMSEGISIMSYRQNSLSSCWFNGKLFNPHFSFLSIFFFLCPQLLPSHALLMSVSIIKPCVFQMATPLAVWMCRICYIMPLFACLGALRNLGSQNWGPFSLSVRIPGRHEPRP